MADNQKMRPTNISRRSVLQGVALAVGATPIILATTYPEGRPKLRELQAVRPTVLLHAR